MSDIRHFALFSVLLWAAASASAASPAPILGNIDGMTPHSDGSQTLHGWTCQQGNNAAIQTNVYLGGPNGTGTFSLPLSVLANSANEAAVNTVCQDTGSHRFNITIPALVVGQFSGQRIYVYGLYPQIGATGGGLLNGSGTYAIATAQALTVGNTCTGVVCDYTGAREGVSTELSCASGTMTVQSATFGAGTSTESCASYLASLCNGKDFCEPNFNNGSCGGDPDPNVYKSASAIVSCVQSSTSTEFPGVAAEPLVVTSGSSHVVAMAYEAWFGPHTLNFQNVAATPLLSSTDMSSAGLRGYDSADPAIIRQHVKWLENLGMDAVTIDLTNGMACTFDSFAFASTIDSGCTSGAAQFWQNLKNNTGNLYPAWTKLGTRLKIIPMIGGADADSLSVDTDGKTAIEHGLDYFAGLMSQYPNLSVIYEGKPLILVFFGAAQSPDTVNSQWAKVMQLIAQKGYNSMFTVKMAAGLMDSQPALWLNANSTPTGPIQMSPKYPFFSLVDRLKPSYGLYPSYNLNGSVVENLAASISTASSDNGWGSNNTYDPGDALRGNGETFQAFMAVADQLKPTFLFVNQFNEYTHPDQGWDANTINDMDPTNLWGFQTFQVVRDQIYQYRGLYSSNLNMAGSPIGYLPMGSASSNDVLSGWPASSAVDGNFASSYSSYPFTSTANTRGTYLAAWLKNGPQLVSHVLLRARLLSGVPTGFPAAYDIYVTASSASQSSPTWTYVGNFTAQPDSNGLATAYLGFDYTAAGVKIVPTLMGTNNPGGNYFQMAEIGLGTDYLQYAPSAPSTVYPIVSATSNDALSTQPASNVVVSSNAYYSSNYFSSSANDRGTYLQGLMGSQQQVSKVILTARMSGIQPIAFPITYDVYLTAPGSKTSWNFIGHFSTSPNANGVATIDLGGTYATWGVQIIPTTLSVDDNVTGLNHYFQLSQIQLGSP